MTVSALNIAMIVERFDPSGGGAERSAYQIAQELVARGHRLTVLTGATPLEAPAEINVRVPDRRYGWSALGLWRFARWCREQLALNRYDVSLSVTTAVAADLVQPRGGTVRETLARNVAMRRSIISRFMKRVLLYGSPKKQVLLFRERRTFADPRVHMVLALSGYVAEQLQRHYAIPSRLIRIIPNAAVMPAVDEAQRQRWRRQVRSSFGIDESSSLFLFAAHNPALKGYETLLRAIKLMKDQGRPPMLMVAGRLSYAHHARAVALGIRPFLRLAGATSLMPQLYCAADVTVLPTFYDPSSKVVIESLLMGTPAITTSYNGAADFVVEPNGIHRGRVLADPGDPRALADAMLTMMDPAERARYRAATVGLADRLSMHRHVDELESVLRGVVALKHGDRREDEADSSVILAVPPTGQRT